MILEMVAPVFYYHCPMRRGAGAAERGGLENRCGFTPTVGSNPTLSASLIILPIAALQAASISSK